MLLPVLLIIVNVEAMWQ